MTDTANPYTPGQPVDDPNLFFGHRDVLSSIREHLIKGRRVFVVSGVRRIGKSSLLRRLAADLPDGMVSVCLGLAAAQGSHPHQPLQQLAEAIAQQLVLPRAEGGDDGEQGSDLVLEAIGTQVRAALGNQCLVLMLDDVHSVDLEEPTSGADPLAQLLTELAVWRERDRNLALVLTTPPGHQDRLARKYPRLFGGATTYELGPLTSEEATRLITWPVDGSLTYDYGVARRLIEISSGHPYYLQLLCSEVFKRCSTEGWVNQRDIDLVVEDLVKREIPEFTQVWQQSSSQEQVVLAALVSLRGARGVATAQEVRTILTKARSFPGQSRLQQDEITDVLDHLTRRGVLERLGALSYRFRVALLRDWLGERVDLDEVVHDARWVGAARVRSSAERDMTKLHAHAGEGPSPTVPKAELEGAGAEDAEPRQPTKRLGLLIAATIILAVVLAVVAWQLIASSPAQVAHTETAVPTFTARLVVATRTSVAVATDQPREAEATDQTIVVAASATSYPTSTHTGLPSATATATLPVIVARSVPAIAYLSQGQGEEGWALYLMNSDGSGRVRIGDVGAGFLSPPTWSPDGSQLAYVSESDGSADIWIMNNDGSNAVNLTKSETKDHSPAWSPDGEWVAFASVRDAAYWELYRMRPDGSDVERLTWWEDASDLWPSWSPDGSRIVFGSKRDGNWEIYVMDRDGSNLARLTDHPDDDTNPEWSPDGTRIAFESTREGYTEIYVMPVVGGEAVNISRERGATDLGPTWSPDGSRIAFYSDRDGEWDIYVMTSDGSEVAKLTGDGDNDQVPAWRP
jgi:Tol biopolymer transport system component